MTLPMYQPSPDRRLWAVLTHSGGMFIVAWACMCVHVCVIARCMGVRACMRARVRAGAGARGRGGVRACACVCAYTYKNPLPPKKYWPLPKFGMSDYFWLGKKKTPKGLKG